MAKDAAELAALFGMETPAEEPEKVDASGTPPAKVEDSGEGKGQPSGVAAPKEPTGQATSEPPAEIPSEDARNRYEELLGELKRYQRYEPIIQMFEEEPELARQVAASRFGPAKVQEPQQAPVGPQPVTPEKMQEIRAYWEKRMTDDPVGGLAEFIDRLVDERTSRTRNTSVKGLIRNYKTDRKAEDPLFAKYEHVFDALVNRADANALQEDPDTSLAAIENLAFGTWARQERAKAARVKAAGAAPAREVPRPLATSTTTAPAGGGTRPKPTLTDEEKYLADLYGEDLLTPEETEQSVWGR